MIIPSIDIMHGKAVQLRQGKEKVLERDDVLALAKQFSIYGEIVVVDLDAAFGKGDNSALIKEICKRASCRVGGGIRTYEKATELLQTGAKKIVIGTMATPEFLKKLPKDRLVVALDTKDNVVVNEGWTKKTTMTPEQMLRELEGYCSEFLFTNVNDEGLMQGIDFTRICELRSATRNNFTVAGGITTIDDIKNIESIKANAQIGMALYTGKINLSEAFIALLDFDKNNGLIPTIVQESSGQCNWQRDGQVLMLGFSTPESLRMSLESGKATYYSRSRKKIWVKGETSGNYQDLVTVHYDCDRDALLFKVRQKNSACHEGTYSCFGNREFSIDELYELIAQRINNPQEAPPKSYTVTVARDETLLKEKILEETQEIINYTDRENLIWEIADLTYFVMVLMAKKNISLTDIKNELWRRRK
ncbi:phosphoribosyl-ATP diphosphatase [Candidatus Woesearchaeota archaeon]|nr:phosphoribosyl-ATP diphosphatase [Candidatus Woesearchaeota archaeon]